MTGLPTTIGTVSGERQSPLFVPAFGYLPAYAEDAQ